ncbi:MAG: branched-chain amino acid ABC transporter permease [Chloroflexota bacterium]
MRRIFQIVSIALLIILLVSLPFVTDKDSLINLVILIFLYIILASSWNILGGYTGQTSLGHAAFFGIGSLVARLLWTDGFPYLGSLLAGGVVAVLFALLIGVPAFRLKGVYFAIGTLALGQILNITVGNVFPNISSLPVEDLAAYQLLPRYFLVFAVTLITIGSTYLLVNSRLGLGIMSVREDEDAAESLGVSAIRHKLIALTLSAFFTGLAGGAFAYYHVSYYFNFPFTPVWSFDALTMVYIGGQGTIIGPIIGAVFFVLLREFLVLNLGEYHLIVFGVLFILVVLFLPGGIVEAWERTRKLVTRLSGSKGVPGLSEKIG